MMDFKSKKLAEFFANELGIPTDKITPSLCYQSIPEWDSIKHVTLMLALEKEYSITIDEAQTMEFTQYRNIQQFIIGGGHIAEHQTKNESVESVVIHRGLRNVYVDSTLISHINGEQGTLQYRGYNIDEVVKELSYEQTVFLLLEGHLPSSEELQVLNNALVAARKLPQSIIDLITTLKDAKPIDVLRTAVSALGAVTTRHQITADRASLLRDSGISLISQLPLVLGYHQAVVRDEQFIMPPNDLTHAEFVLACLFVSYDDPILVQHFENDLIVHAEHGLNASAFAARIAAGAESGIHAIITAAISTFQGALHGGAAEEVLHVIEEAKQIDSIDNYVQSKVNSGQSVMGFGHRVYRTEDPRVKHLYHAASFMSEHSHISKNVDDMEVIAAILKAMSPYQRHGVSANVDLYAGVFYKQLGLDSSLTVPLFAISRVAGWLSHVLEQKANNILIRPRLHYVGEVKTFDIEAIA